MKIKLIIMSYELTSSEYLHVMRSFGPPKNFAACILWRHYISVITVEN